MFKLIELYLYFLIYLYNIKQKKIKENWYKEEINWAIFLLYYNCKINLKEIK